MTPTNTLVDNTIEMMNNAPICDWIAEYEENVVTGCPTVSAETACVMAACAMQPAIICPMNNKKPRSESGERRLRELISIGMPSVTWHTRSAA